MSTSIGNKNSESKYLEFAEDLRCRIEAGKIEPGERLPSFQRVRQRYGLSQSTVERAYKLLEDQKLIERRPYSGFYVIEPHLRTMTGVIALTHSFPEQHHYYLRLLHGVQDVARKQEMEVLLLHESSRVVWEKVDGVLSCDPNPEVTNDRLPPGMPYVSLLHPGGARCIMADDYQGTHQAALHLLELGHKRIAYLTIAHTESCLEVHRQRVAGYKDALRSAGIKPSKQWIYPLQPLLKPVMDFHDFGYTQMKRWLSKNWDELGCTAVLAHNDETALGIITALEEAGRRVPQEISVMGFDGLNLHHPWCGALTSIRVPLYEVGALGTQTLIQWIKEPLAREMGNTSRVVLPTEIQNGQSTARPMLTEVKL